MMMMTMTVNGKKSTMILSLMMMVMVMVMMMTKNIGLKTFRPVNNKNSNKKPMATILALMMKSIMRLPLK